MTDDKALVSRILRGDNHAFRALINQNQRLVAHMVARLIDNREDREELCQDIFLKIYQKIGAFSFNSKLSTWIASIAYHHAINHLRKARIEVTEMPDEVTFSKYFIADTNPEEKLDEAMKNAIVESYIQQLPPQYKAVLTLYHMEHMNYLEIGDVLKMPEGTVKNYLFRARALVKEKISKYLDKDELL